MGDAKGAREVLELLRDRVARPGGRLFVHGVAAMTTMSEGHLDDAVKLCERVLAEPGASRKQSDERSWAARWRWR
jgi:hypothetical protein